MAFFAPGPFKQSPTRFDVYLVNVKSSGRLFQILVAFSEYPNFRKIKPMCKVLRIYNFEYMLRKFLYKCIFDLLSLQHFEEKQSVGSSLMYSKL